ncbi:hypothetical protein BBO99_00004602 [Phytophthora kernoviae]|uniref:Tudor domain-containing protein n=3 Tax=Phytophthora kernoviae TaxID=325452 RepID=A0A3R7GA52_9STRA|nr:hypothetical protein G195_005269 [Phytophthora kernoviae 00238/432]KAG2525585.1 hypothetical protein JM16_004105 [Phytophthora kernoviae]RLN46355.1 hypothetical protein BBI17_004473 [Phytophthora kernoviae]RLN80278.1 hypothetical protein BBO99_00004602 [Phytophthora kernoviae]
MKTTAMSHDRDESDDENVENCKLEEEEIIVERVEIDDERKYRGPTAFSVGSRVERELDGLWFAGTITDADPDSDAYEIEYDEDMNREGEVSASELRLLDPSRTREASAKTELTAQEREMLRKDSLLMQTPDYDPNKAPTVVVHHQGETNSATGYIINGLENNVAAGNGLRGIRETELKAQRALVALERVV